MTRQEFNAYLSSWIIATTDAKCRLGLGCDGWEALGRARLTTDQIIRFATEEALMIYRMPPVTSAFRECENRPLRRSIVPVSAGAAPTNQPGALQEGDTNTTMKGGMPMA